MHTILLLLSIAIIGVSLNILTTTERFYFNVHDQVMTLDDVPQLHTMEEAVKNDEWNYDTLANLKMSTQHKTWIKNIN
jgi:hypothetical protein